MCVKSKITSSGWLTPDFPFLSEKIAFGIVLLLFTVNALAAPPQRLIVRYERATGTGTRAPDEQELAAIAAIANTNVTFVRSGSGGNQIIELDGEIDAKQMKEITAAVGKLDNVISASPDRRFHIQSIPNDPDFEHQWYLGEGDGGINAVNAWEYTTGNKDTVIAVLDTGILPHSDYNGRYLDGYDFISDLFVANDGDGRDANPSDPGDAVTVNDCAIGNPVEDEPSSWHGTAITGLIAANTNNNYGIAGIDHKAKILPVRVLGRCGGYVSDLADAIRWAAGISDDALPFTNPNPAGIINLSLGNISLDEDGNGVCLPIEQDAINDATAAGALVVVSAGNEGMDVEAFSPANCDNVLTVAATTRTGGETCYTNYGDKIDMSAPGGNASGINNCTGRTGDMIYTTSNSGTTGPANEGFTWNAGTSFAAPLVSGAAALIRAVNPTLSPAEVKTILLNSAREFPTGTSDSYGDCNTSRCGAGLLDARRAIESTRDDALSLPGTGTIQMVRVEDCVLEDVPSIQVEVQRVDGEGPVAAQIVSERMSAIADDDFGAINEIVVWAPDELSAKTLTIPVFQDNAVEGAEFFATGIATPSINANVGYPASTRVTIVSTNGNTRKSCAQPAEAPEPAPDPSSGGGTLSLLFLCLQLIILALRRLLYRSHRHEM